MPKVWENAKAHHTLAAFCRETPDFLSPTKLSGFLAHHTLADFLSPILCRVTSRAFKFYAGTVKRSRQNDRDKKDMK